MNGNSIGIPHFFRGFLCVQLFLGVNYFPMLDSWIIWWMLDFNCSDWTFLQSNWFELYGYLILGVPWTPLVWVDPSHLYIKVNDNISYLNHYALRPLWHFYSVCKLQQSTYCLLFTWLVKFCRIEWCHVISFCDWIDATEGAKCSPGGDPLPRS